MSLMRPMMAIAIAITGLASCTSIVTDVATSVGNAHDSALALDLLQHDFRSKGAATLARVTVQDDVQKLCSALAQESPGAPATQMKSELRTQLTAQQMATIRWPADGIYLGNWQEGEKIAQNGRGMQSSDAIGAVNGGNCYACHQMGQQEISFGNLGPSLARYGTRHGHDADIVKSTWAKIYNAQASVACSAMPRFGHNGILTQLQLKDVMALLFDAQSPLNQ